MKQYRKIFMIIMIVSVSLFTFTLAYASQPDAKIAASDIASKKTTEQSKNNAENSGNSSDGESDGTNDGAGNNSSDGSNNSASNNPSNNSSDNSNNSVSDSSSDDSTDNSNNKNSENQNEAESSKKSNKKAKEKEEAEEDTEEQTSVFLPSITQSENVNEAKGEPDNPNSNFTGDSENKAHAAATTAMGNPASKRIFVIIAQYITWDDITEKTTPNLYSILGEAGLGNLITRADGRDTNTVIGANETALCLANGRWETDIRNFITVPTNGNLTKSSKASYVGSEEFANTSTCDLLGRMGDMFEKYSWASVALGNSDIQYLRQRPAAALLAGSDGNINISYTQQKNLLTDDEDAAYGKKTNVEFMRKKLDAALDECKNSSAIIALDPGDLNRAGAYKIENPGNEADEYWKGALSTFDQTVDLALNRMGENDVLFIVGSMSEVTQANHQDDNYVPLIIYGSDYDGQLCSKSMKRDDLTIVSDVSRTIIVCAGFTNETIGTGKYCRIAKGTKNMSVEELIKQLDTDTDYSVAINKGFFIIIPILLVIMCVAIVLSLIVLISHIRLKRLTLLNPLIPVTRLLWLFIAAIPPAANLMGLFKFHDITTVEALLIFFACSLLIFVISCFIAGKTKWLYGMLFTLGLTVVVICGDQLFGGKLASIGFLTYQPIFTSRFTGVGNEGAGLSFGAYMLFTAFLMNSIKESPLKRKIVNYAYPIVSVIYLALIIAPWWGANFGVLIWGIASVLITWWTLRGRRFSWIALIITVILSICALVLLVVVEAKLGYTSHLGNKGSDLLKYGITYIPVILNDMFTYDMMSLVYSPVSTIGFFVGWGTLAVIRIKKPGAYNELFEENQDFKGVITAAMIASVLTFLFEDSGIALPALILLYVAMGFVWIACDDRVKKLKQQNAEYTWPYSTSLQFYLKNLPEKLGNKLRSQHLNIVQNIGKKASLRQK